MIKENTKKDLSKVLFIINDAALNYKGVIPDYCWHEPYMIERELISEVDNGVRMFGYRENNKLVGVMGIQKLEGVTLIRHAYTLNNYQGKGIGTSLLQYLFEINESDLLLVGTWREASWAIQFYQKFGFIAQTKKQTHQLLKKYWDIPSKQINNSIVLAKNISN